VLQLPRVKRGERVGLHPYCKLYKQTNKPPRGHVGRTYTRPRHRRNREQTNQKLHEESKGKSQREPSLRARHERSTYLSHP
jgi:hypothetical protein